MHSQLRSGGSNAETMRTQAPLNGIFATLPLPIPSKLPVHIHGTFSLQGDRRSLTIDEDGDSQHAGCNTFLLREAVPEVYLTFLEYVARKSPAHASKFWPLTNPISTGVAKQVIQALLQKLPTSPRHLYIKRPTTASNQGDSPVTFAQAVFRLETTLSPRLMQCLVDIGIPLVQETTSAVTTYLKGDENTPRLTVERLKQHLRSAKAREVLKSCVTHDSEKSSLCTTYLDCSSALAQPPRTWKVAIFLDSLTMT